MALKTLLTSVVVQNSDGSWDNRTSTNVNSIQLFERVVPGSADPASVTSPAVNGAYTNDIVIGA